MPRQDYPATRKSNAIQIPAKPEILSRGGG
jgi:hypothetical protein